TALFHGGSGLESPETLSTSFETVMSFTWVHVLVFLLIGVAASRLIALAERNPSFGFGIVLFFVFFECAFVLFTMVFAQPVLPAPLGICGAGAPCAPRAGGAGRPPPRRRDDDGEVLAPPPPPGHPAVGDRVARAPPGRISRDEWSARAGRRSRAVRRGPRPAR